MLRAEMRLLPEGLDEYTRIRRDMELRADLYRAIYAGDMDRAEDVINLMAMVDIDRGLIWSAKSEVRKGVDYAAT